MPLLDRASHNAALRPGGFSGQQQLQQSQYLRHDYTSHGETPTHRPNIIRARQDSDTSSDDRISNPLSARDIAPLHNDRRDRARDMKMNIPGMPFGVPNTSSKEFDAATSKQSFKQRPSAVEGRDIEAGGPSPFDDTTSLSIEDDLLQHEPEDLTAIHHGEWTQDLAKRPQIGYQQRQLRPTINLATTLGDRGIDSTQFAMAQHENGLQEGDRQVHHSTYWQNKRGFSPPHPSAQAVEQPASFGMQGSSQAQKAAPTQTKASISATKTVCFQSPDVGARDSDRADSPELQLPSEMPKLGTRADPVKSLHIAKSESAHNTGSTHRDGRAVTLAPKDNGPGPLQRDTFNSSRTSDYPTSSEEDEAAQTQSDPAAQKTKTRENHSGLKRYRDKDIDYDTATLRAMKYDDLDVEEFERNEKVLSPKTTFDAQGNPLTLSQRLTNLGRMSEEEQKIMFRSQDDKEWAQIGSWFIDRFQEGLQKLMDVKYERRKISMRFEDEIRRRQKEVEQCSDCVEKELRDLKKGGGELIKGKEASSRRGTPQRRGGD